MSSAYSLRTRSERASSRDYLAARVIRRRRFVVPSNELCGSTSVNINNLLMKMHQRTRVLDNDVNSRTSMPGTALRRCESNSSSLTEDPRSANITVNVVGTNEIYRWDDPT